MPIAIIVHGGAGTAAPDRVEIVQAGCKEAARVGWDILEAGGSALDAVEAAVRSLEDDPNFNAGTGACLTTEGNIELDAGMMDGHKFAVGAVTGVELIKNPISLARKVLESPHVLLSGKGAQGFAQEQGIPECTFEDLLTERQFEIWKTMQAAKEIEEPRSDRLAAATSTGGISNKYPGRVGDSPLVGCGFYADEQAAISCTGDGEDFVRLLIAKRAADFVARGNTAREAAEAAIAVLGEKATGTGGLIIVDRLGNVGFAWNSQNMSHAYMVEGLEEPVTGV